MYVAFVGHEETGSDLHAAGSEHECRGRSPSVEDSAGGKNGDVEGVDNLWHKGHGVVVADMSAGFRAFGYYGIGAAFLHLERVCDRSDHRNHLDSRRLPCGHVDCRGAGAGGKYPDAFLDHHAGHFRRIGRLEHDVYAERLVGKFAAFADFLPHGLRAEVYG